ncbi:MAG: hypothetical protein PQJ50_17360 [Spirochaetales bacterium]|nr:hypothetical protein [Spirochaetales bacterium]
MVKKTLIIFFILTGVIFWIHAESNDLITLNWADMDALYHIEIRKDGYVFFETDQMENELSLDLVPGYYEYQIYVRDPFGRELSNSGWIPLNVTRSQTPVFRLIQPVMIASVSKESFIVPVDSSDLNPGTKFYIQRKQKTLKGEWNDLRSLDGEVTFRDVRLRSGSWELVAVDPSGEVFSQPGAVIAKPMYRPESSLRDSQFDIQLGISPVAGFVTDVFDLSALSLWNADLVLLVQSGSTAPFLRDLGLEFHGRIGYVGVDPVTVDTGLFGGGELSLFLRPNTGGRITPFIQGGTGFLMSGSDDFFNSRTALVFRGAAGVDFNRNRHYTRIGMGAGYGYTNDQSMVIFDLFVRWGYQL